MNYGHYVIQNFFEYIISTLFMRERYGVEQHTCILIKKKLNYQKMHKHEIIVW